MKITKCFQKAFILLLMTCLLIKCERMETIASFKSSFKSNYKLMQQKQAPTTMAPPVAGINAQPEESASSLIKKAGDDLPDVPIYFQGWIKYFRYAENGQEKPSKFFKNSSFEKQLQAKDGEEAKDKFGSKKIPSEKHFFLVMYKDTANILTSRENPLMTVADSLIIDFIKTIPEDNNYLGGVKDFGKFSEGSCFEVSTIKPGAFFQMSSTDTEPSTGLREKWLICSDDDANKKQMMNIMIKLKLKKQHNLGVYISTSNDPLRKNNSLSPSQNNPTISDLMTNKTNTDTVNNPNRQPQDGYWITLQDWTPCTLKCGGGLQYLQLICSPPRSGGKPCEGEAIRTRPCNPQPCPKIETVKSVLPKSNNPNAFVAKPIIKMMAISSRPQRYDKCYLKDTDALMLRTDFPNSPPVKLPIRLVMNNKSISVYQDETLTTNMMTFLLSNTRFSRVNGDTRCFILSGLNTKAQFCQLDSQAGKFVEEWDYDFNLFKFQCKQKRETVDIAANEEKKLEKDFKDKVNQLKQDLVEKKAEEIKKQVENKEEVKLQKKIEQTQAMTLMAIQKELKLEEMLEKEESQREQEEQNTLAMQIEAEKKKKECLTKSIKQKQIEDQMNISKANAEEAIAQIKEEAKKQIILKRNAIKKKLESMRKNNKRRLTQMQNEIINLRVETAGKVQKYAKVGDIKNCFNPIGLAAAATPKMEEYCQINFADSYGKFMECKSPDTFCYVCCETEFGEMHMSERQTCYKQVCENDPAKPNSVVLAGK